MKRAFAFALCCGAIGLGLALESGCSNAHAFPVPVILRANTPLQLELALNGAPVPLGALVADGGTAVNNCTGCTGAACGCPSPGLQGMTLLLYANNTGRMLPVTTNTGYATATAGDGDAGVPLGIGERVLVTMPDTPSWLSWNSDGGVALEFWRLQ